MTLENSISIPKVIYASRTHSQLAQVVRELKRLREIGYDIKMSVLGGRGTTCLHPKVSKEKDNAIQQTMDSKLKRVILAKIVWNNFLEILGQSSNMDLIQIRFDLNKGYDFLIQYVKGMSHTRDDFPFDI